MKLTELKLKGLFLVEMSPHRDERGFFARSWCAREFAEAGLDKNLVQCNVSFNTQRGILRGMHFQKKPHEEAKLVRCTRGRIFDVAVDIRPDSPTYGQWHGLELSADNHRALYIPGGFAHGFQTLEDNSEVFYQMGEFYHPESQGGLLWNDEDVGIQWPLPDPLLSPRDQMHPKLPQLGL